MLNTNTTRTRNYNSNIYQIIPTQPRPYFMEKAEIIPVSKPHTPKPDQNKFIVLAIQHHE